jgi:hypothetical protein
MCSHYQAIKERERYIRHFGVEPPAELGKFDVWPGSQRLLFVDLERPMWVMKRCPSGKLSQVSLA